MRPRDPQKGDTIRKQAIEMLVVEGVDGFSMQKLARAAGVSPATLYIHFKDKDDLLYQLWAEQAEALTKAVLAGFDPAAGFAEGLWIQWQNRIQFFRDNPLGWRLLDQVRHSSLQGKYVARTPVAFFEAMGAFISNALARGELTSFGFENPGDATYPKGLFWSLAYAPLYEMLRLESAPAPEGEPPFVLDEATVQKAFQCVLRGLRP